LDENIKKCHLTDCKQIQQAVFHLIARGIPKQNIYAKLVDAYYVDLDLLNDALYPSATAIPDNRLGDFQTLNHHRT
jgi:hypothetical protein